MSKKKNVGFKLINQIKKQYEYFKKEYKQYELAKLIKHLK